MITVNGIYVSHFITFFNQNMALPHLHFQKSVTFCNLLNQYNLKCTFNLHSELLGKPGMIIRNKQRIVHYKRHPDDIIQQHAGIKYCRTIMNTDNFQRHSNLFHLNPNIYHNYGIRQIDETWQRIF